MVGLDLIETQKLPVDILYETTRNKLPTHAMEDR